MMTKGDSILIVDDSEEIRTPLKLMLELEGFDVVGVESGRAALGVLRERDAFSLILLDLTMPDMSGTEFLDERQKEGLDEKAPVVIFSAAHLDQSELPPGVVGQIKKPIAFPDLIRSIKQLH